MKEISDEIYAFFINNTAFTDVVGQRLFPAVANKTVSFPFAIYTINQREGQTKDADRFAITTSVYFKPDQYTDCVSFADTVKTIVDNSKYDWQESDVSFVEEDKSFVADIRFIIN